ncbi:DUF5993 family protein [Piscirickettsia litoralis]|uniref:DUF5993 family protein n=1 Tax=Piscirickettsia litoralis TaxID=1891921 RepID=UPI00373FE0E9
MAFLFIIYLAVYAQIFFKKTQFIKSQFVGCLVLTLVWFNHHSTDSLGLSW